MAPGTKCERSSFIALFVTSLSDLNISLSRELEVRLIRCRISNAALHWILRDESTRLSVLRAIYNSLRSKGTFVFEMGGHGNVPEVHTALLSALVNNGATLTQARESSPWFFPSETWMRKVLEDLGFHIEILEIEYRPTKLTRGVSGGLEG